MSQSNSNKIAAKINQKIQGSKHKETIYLSIVGVVFILLSYTLFYNLTDGLPYTGTKITGLIICGAIVLICFVSLFVIIRHKIKQKK